MATIGGTRPSGQPLAGTRARTRPDAFGAGVGQALGSLARGVAIYGDSTLDVQAAEDELAAAQLEREEKVHRFGALRSFTEWEESQRRRLLELSEGIAPDGSGFTNTVQAEIEKSRLEWLDTIPPLLRDEFDTRSKSLSEGFVTSAYEVEFKQQDAFFRQGLEDDANQALSRIYADPGKFNDEVVTYLQKIQSSTLSKLEKEAVANQFRAAAEESKFKKVQHLSLLTAGMNRPANGKDIVAAGLPAIARGVLNGIASVEADGYDVLNGGERFDSFEDHPAERGQSGKESTAAGRYQFVKGTWRRAAAAVGAPSMEPEWQDRAAWWLAQADFKERTGRNLYDVLMSGDREAIKATRSILQPTWDGLKNMTDDAWANHVMGSQGQRGGGTEVASVGPNLFEDPQYANIPFERKLALTADAEREAEQIKAARAKAAQDQYNEWFRQQEFAVGMGERGRADIEAMLAEGQFDKYADYERLVSIHEGRTKGIEDLVRGVEMLAGGRVFDPGNKDHRDGLDAIVTESGGIEMLEQHDQAFVTDQLVPLTAQAQVIPPAALGTLEGMSRSSDPQRLGYTFQALRQLEQVAPLAYRTQVPESVQKEAELFNGLQSVGRPLEDIVGRLRKAREFRQEYPELVKDAEKAWDELDINQVMEKLDPQFISITADPERPLDPHQNQVFMREAYALFTDSFVQSGDPDVAYEMMAKRLAKTWMPVERGGRWRLTKHPPELSGYPQVGQRWDWIEDQVRKDLPQLETAKEFQMFADPTTVDEIGQYAQALQRGEKTDLPSYPIFYLDENGEGHLLRNEQNQIVRWHGDPQPYIEQQNIAVGVQSQRDRLQYLHEKEARTQTPRTREEEVEFRRLRDQFFPEPTRSPHPETREERERRQELMKPQRPNLPPSILGDAFRAR